MKDAISNKEDDQCSGGGGDGRHGRGGAAIQEAAIKCGSVVVVKRERDRE